MYTYEEAIAYIEEIPKFTKKNKLEHTKECLRRLGSPQKDKKVIHTAGTNGKGSVCAFAASMLKAGGYRVGLFTSPHLVDIRERFQIDEIPVDKETFLQAFCQVKELSDSLIKEGSYHPTYFEFLFLMGMLVFQEADVDYIVLETGLGGRLDATNSIANPIACVITSISLDHMEYLGDTIPSIAEEKAGIMKQGIPVIYDANNKEAAAVIAKRAEMLHCPAYPVTQGKCEILQIAAGGIDFSFNSEYYGTTAASIPFIARYQVMNASLALQTMGVLADSHHISREKLVTGMKHTRWQGRMETILPGVIADGAHNEDGIERFIETARDFSQDYEITVLFSAVADKDYRDMISHICKELEIKQVVTTQVGGDRAVPAKELAQEFKRQGCTCVHAIDSAEGAFEEANQLRKEGLLFCVGSLYLVGEIKAMLSRRGCGIGGKND